MNSYKLAYGKETLSFSLPTSLNVQEIEAKSQSANFGDRRGGSRRPS